MIPWSLYNLTPRDMAGALLRPFHETQRTTGVGVTFDTHRYTVPEEVMLLVTLLSSSINTSANALAVLWEIRDRNAQLHTEIYDPAELFPAGNLHQSKEMVGAPITVLSPGDTIDFTHTLTAAGNTTMRTSVSGVLIPRGTIAIT